MRPFHRAFDAGPQNSLLAWSAGEQLRLFAAGVLAAALLAAVFCPGATRGQNRLEYGVRGGPVSMTIKDLDGNVQRRVGLSAGIFTRIDLPGPYSLQPELLYVQKGAETTRVRVESIFGTSILDRRTYQLGYVELPLLARAEIPLPSVPFLTPTLSAGPTAGIRVRSERNLRVAVGRSFEEIDPEEIGLNPPPFSPNRLEAGLIVGAGVEIDVRSITLITKGRYRYGLTSVAEPDRIEALNLGPNKGFAVSIGARF